MGVAAIGMIKQERERELRKWESKELAGHKSSKRKGKRIVCVVTSGLSCSAENSEEAENDGGVYEAN